MARSVICAIGHCDADRTSSTISAIGGIQKGGGDATAWLASSGVRCAPRGERVRRRVVLVDNSRTPINDIDDGRAGDEHDSSPDHNNC